jgi:hypothetical protein
VFLVKYEAAPAIKLADVKAQTGNFAIESVSLKLTGKVTQKKEQYYLGATELVKGTDEEAFKKLGEFITAKKTVLVVSGILSEDPKGKQSLALQTVAELDKKGK